MGEEDRLPAVKRLLFRRNVRGTEVSDLCCALVKSSGASPVTYWLRVRVTEDDRFVEREEMGHPVVIAFKDHLSVRGKIFDDVLAQPAAVQVLEIERQIPVIKRNHGLHTVFQAGIDDIVIVCQTFFVHLAASEGEDT